MSKNRMIDTKFWDDSYIINLDPIEKLLFLYFLTNPLTSICGIYEITLKRVAFDTGVDKDMILKILNRFDIDNKIKYIDSWIIIKNFIKNQKQSDNENDKVNIGIQRALEKIPEKIKNFLNLNLNLNSNINSNINVPLSTPSRPLEEKKIYGSLNNVLLTEKEYNKLVEEYEENIINKYIESLSTYLPNRKGKPYKDHNAVIRNWLNKDNACKKQRNFLKEYIEEEGY
jgi:hypothetical protein